MQAGSFKWLSLCEVNGGAPKGKEEASGSFLKKRTKKRLLNGGIWRRRCVGLQVFKVFLLLFVHKKKVFLGFLKG
jgi:hypothetical protein